MFCRAAPSNAVASTNNTKVVNADDGYVKTKWRQERIWIEAVEKEGKAILEWNEKWGFLADYDLTVITDDIHSFSD